MIRTLLFFSALPFVLCIQAASSTAAVYELRTYTTNDGKLDDLHTRFRDHTISLFKKHGMESVGYWVPTDGPKSENTLIYVLKHESRDAAKNSVGKLPCGSGLEKRPSGNLEQTARCFPKRPNLCL